MAVAYWQIYVASSIALTYLFFSRKISFFLAIGWSIWTFLHVKTNSLTVLQLGNAWGTYLLLEKWKAKDQELNEVKEMLKHYSYQIKEKIDEAVKNGKTRILKDSEHYDYLISSLNQAQSSVLILSGWIHYSVVNEQFTRILTRLLEEGVNIYIGFGYEDSKGKHTLYPDSQKALGVLQKLQKQADKFKGKLFVGRFSNHQKILIIDQHKVVCGSNNWLSNRTFRNKEKSIVIEDPNLANEIFKEIIQLIKANPA